MATRLPHKGYLTKAPSTVHEGFTEFIEKTTGHTVPVGDVALVQRLYPVYLKSPAVVKAREAEAAAKAREAAEKQALKEERLRERLAEVEEKRRKLLAELGIESEDAPEPVRLKTVKDPEPESPVEVLDDDGQEKMSDEEAPEVEDLTLDGEPDEFVESSDDPDDDLWGDEDGDAADEEDF